VFPGSVLASAARRTRSQDVLWNFQAHQGWRGRSGERTGSRKNRSPHNPAALGAWRSTPLPSPALEVIIMSSGLALNTFGSVHFRNRG
jgi:hypothetical protein